MHTLVRQKLTLRKNFQIRVWRQLAGEAEDPWPSVRLGLLALAGLGLGTGLLFDFDLLGAFLALFGLAAFEDVVVLAEDAHDEGLGLGERRARLVKVRKVLVHDEILDLRGHLLDLGPVVVHIVGADLLFTELLGDEVDGLVVHVVLLRVLLVIGSDREEEAERLAREDIDRLRVHLGRACVRFVCDWVAENEVCREGPAARPHLDLGKLEFGNRPCARHSEGPHPWQPFTFSKIFLQLSWAAAHNK